MIHQMTIHCRKQPDAMERILRTIRHRGFELEGISMNSSGCGKQLELAIKVRGLQPLRLLTSQLEKLYDVIEWSQDIRQAQAGYAN